MTDETLNDCIDAAHSALAEENQRLREALGAATNLLRKWVTLWKAGSLGPDMDVYTDEILEQCHAVLAPTRPADADPDISGVPV